MRYLVSIKESRKQKTAPYLKKQLIADYAVIEVENQQIDGLKEQVEAIEPDYEMQLGQNFWHDLGILSDEKVLIITVGKDYLCQEVQYTYDLVTKQWQQQSPRRSKAIWLHAYTKREIMHASDWLEGIEQFYKLAELLKYPLVIVQNIESVLPYFGEKSLATICAVQYMKRTSSLMFRQNRKCNLLQDSLIDSEVGFKIIDTKASSYKLQENIYEWLQSLDEGKTEFKDKSKQSLYQDVFYTQIPSEQKIYVPIAYEERQLGNLEIHKVPIGLHYSILYEKRAYLDEYAQEIQRSLLGNLEQPIATRVTLKRAPLETMAKPYHVSSQDAYTGKGVYIGIITDEGVDYTHPGLRNTDGTTRIASYWIQKEANDGSEYTQKQLNEAIHHIKHIPELSGVQSDNDTTALLVAAGGKSSVYKGMASETQFLVAHIQKAPIALQGIYGGEVSQQAVLLADIVLAVEKLIQKAQLDHKPLVMIIPYETHLSGQNGIGFYENILNELGKLPGCTLITSVGEEGNKKHHQTLLPTYEEGVMRLKVLKDAQYVVGELQFRHIPEKDFQENIGIRCISDQINQSIPLDEQGTYSLKNSTIYTSGLKMNPRNGDYSIRFGIRHLPKGKLELRGFPRMDYQDAQIDLYLQGKNLNPNVICDEPNGFGTINGLVAIEGMIGVGGYNEKNHVALITSGKGEKNAYPVKPYCMVRGIEKYTDSVNKEYEIEGNMVGVALMAGKAALYYEKQQRIETITYANTLEMKQWILNTLKTEGDIAYPNEKYGYGILSLDVL